MNQESLSVLFYLNKAKTNKKGQCPIYCRITFKKKRKQFSIGQFVEPRYWHSKKQIFIKDYELSERLNSQLLLINQKIQNAYLFLQVQNIEFTIEDILDKYIDKKIKKDANVVSYFKQYLVLKKNLIDRDIKLATWKKFEYSCNHLESFIFLKFKKRDYPLSKLNSKFLIDFEYYLKTARNQKQVTVNKVIQRFRKPVRLAVLEGYLERDPFINHKPTRVKKEVVFLSVEELKILEQHEFIQPRLEVVNDLFIFCCYTGLAYNEMSNLCKVHIINAFDGNKWIKMKREKTNKFISVPLLPKAKYILDKYNSTNEKLLPAISNQKMNSYLKEIIEIVGISKRVTHHTARKTFASTVLLYNDVPMEIVSELLGHSSIQITQDYYGKVVQKKVSKEMERLTKKISLK
ncbi:site-specific integrase [uncultured Maribacter sp.]|uniref:site-specific integrase n=1 Tax=uncultured Maribacter sp. TaxID=431308 RepID=UPI0026358778|nr:site-specific integrase [uncultured Maribacter sp.]